MSVQKRAAAIHDISCFGRCSLTVVLPIISAAGIETSIIPTAILSTHTGGFKNYTYRDLTEDILPVSEHWKSLGLGFDALYSGFLGSFRQIEIVKQVFTALKNENTIIVVDPVMADNGKLYATFSEDFPAEMRKLCGAADVIVPNLTEAALLLNEPYKEKYAQSDIERMLMNLADSLGTKKIVLTGVGFGGKTLGAACYDSVSGEIGYAFDECIQHRYHGTGDIFGSVLTAALVRGKSLRESCAAAVKFTLLSIKETEVLTAKDERDGVAFENVLYKLRELI